MRSRSTALRSSITFERGGLPSSLRHVEAAELPAPRASDTVQ